MRKLRQQHSECRQLTLTRFKEIVREQFLLLHYDEKRALAAIPRMLDKEDPARREATFDIIRIAAEAVGDLPQQVKQRLSQVEVMFKGGSTGRLEADDGAGEPATNRQVRLPRKQSQVPVSDAERAKATKSSTGAEPMGQARDGAD